MLGQACTQAHAFSFSGCKAWWTSGFQAQSSPPETKSNVIVWVCSLEADIWGIYVLSSNKWDHSNTFVHCVNHRLIAQITWIILKFLGKVCPVNTVIEMTGHVERLHVVSSNPWCRWGGNLHLPLLRISLASRIHNMRLDQNKKSSGIWSSTILCNMEGV